MKLRASRRRKRSFKGNQLRKKKDVDCTVEGASDCTFEGEEPSTSLHWIF